MCHLILLMPVIALPVFWLMPPGLATPLYAVIALLSGLVYWAMVRAMRKPPEAGVESLVGARAEVVSRLGLGDHAQYLVRCKGELWSANCQEALQSGEAVEVASAHGVKLVVTRQNTVMAKRKGK